MIVLYLSLNLNTIKAYPIQILIYAKMTILYQQMESSKDLVMHGKWLSF